MTKTQPSTPNYVIRFNVCNYLAFYSLKVLCNLKLVLLPKSSSTFRWEYRGIQVVIFFPVSKQVRSRVQKNPVRLKNRTNTWVLGSGSAFHSTAVLLIGFFFFFPSVREHNILSSDVGVLVNPFFIIFFLLLELPAKLKYNKYFSPCCISYLPVLCLFPLIWEYHFRGFP